MNNRPKIRKQAANGKDKSQPTESKETRVFNSREGFAKEITITVMVGIGKEYARVSAYSKDYRRSERNQSEGISASKHSATICLDARPDVAPAGFTHVWLSHRFAHGLETEGQDQV